MEVIGTAATVLDIDWGYVGATSFIPSNSSFCVLPILKYFIHGFAFVIKEESQRSLRCVQCLEYLHSFSFLNLGQLYELGKT